MQFVLQRLLPLPLVNRHITRVLVFVVLHDRIDVFVLVRDGEVLPIERKDHLRDWIPGAGLFVWVQALAGGQIRERAVWGLKSDIYLHSR